LSQRDIPAFACGDASASSHLKKANIKNAYRGTDVHWSKSQTEIYKMLNELGIYDIRFTNLKDKFVLEFLVTLVQGEKPRAVRITVGHFLRRL
jgi:hypothetical protein